ncbi:hypothetical protein GUITHDRAFT_106239 [Guillardia theta CCMP2712]|uniref:Uncharacterized protein n=1 Tax=Guillardia theta (strain CCMP2712) TaxID=905079 RepID=L1JJ30_GUITC|nr:hypothetical protein GUITHDRAFT_106239 [Guillardia theta CCMP2712]EKX48164.1 hypothetical protein GUITHDRAFT_106239 [Guillardia theta CCMP2712]|eukprot:XP_005835144.1 hypothetical protein GUITHDRAFT_106239 [Guillardia theta CCMP2712]
MATMTPDGEMQLTEEECEKLSLPPNSVIPANSVDEVKQKLQDIADDEIRKLARQIGTKPAEEPYPGYYEDVQRLGLEDDFLKISSVNPASLYGPGGKPYAPWMVGKVNEGPSKKRVDKRSKEDREFDFTARGQELGGAGGGGFQAALLGDEVKLTFTVGEEANSKGYVITKRPGGSADDAYQLVADYLTPGANLAAGQLNGKYSYVDGASSPGVWVYRVQEEDVSGKKTVLSQTIIDIPSNTDKVKALVAAAVLGGALTFLTFLGVSMDPQNGIN